MDYTRNLPEARSDKDSKLPSHYVRDTAEIRRKVCEQPDTQTYKQTYIFPFETSACAPSYGAERDIHTMKSPSPQKGWFIHSYISRTYTATHLDVGTIFAYTEWTMLHT
ncbi:hypothetical protein DPMN_033552 [Dreissena polymorpha]|uniref:Uncharacterized protein n=1 Tax=Dreissena polymorpha TaxID=45954 RepID=A0A9D4M517_DREPO|nr:hypothetical protein DPMN_033552 [Dreissena polymorpha]